MDIEDFINVINKLDQRDKYRILPQQIYNTDYLKNTWNT